MLTALQQRKIANLFAVHDLDRDGVIEGSDFETYTRRIAEVRGWAPGSPEYSELLGRFMNFWEGLRGRADRSHDDRITIREWLAYWDKILATEGMYERQARPIADMVFGLLDRDGAVTAEEYAMLYSSGGLDASLAANAFRKLDLDRDGRLNVSDMLALLSEFFRSTDPASPGNWLFGPFEERSPVEA